jgi:CheY-like chemotaxis protein
VEDKAILLVEDNPKDVLLTRRALKKASIANELIVRQDGVEALAFLFGEDGRSGCPPQDLPVVILLDLKMPRVDGFGVLRRIRATEKTSLQPVVILTSSDDEKDIVDSYHLGANSYVRKPVSFNAFTEAMRTLGLYWLVINEPPPQRRN